MDSSPFVERPKPMDDPLLEVNTLKFQVRDLENQLAMERLQHEEALEALKKELLEQQKKTDDYASDQLFYYEANKDLKSKLEHIRDNQKLECEGYEKKLQDLRAQLQESEEAYQQHKAGDGERLRETLHENQRLKDALKDSESVKAELEQELEQQRQATSEAKLALAEKEDEIDKLKFRLQTMPSEEEVKNAQMISKKLGDQMGYIKELEHKNLQQSEHIKHLTLNKTNNEILKSEIASLKTKLQRVDELNDTINDLNMQLLEQKQENNKWKVYLNEEDDVKIEEFVKQFKALKDENLILKGNFMKLESELKTMKHTYNELFVKHESLQKTFDALSSASDGLTRLNRELEQQRDLAFEESTYLREQLKSISAELEMNESGQSAYIAKLEETVEGYKAKIESLTKEMPKEMSNKRPRSEIEGEEDTTRNFQRNISSLEDANFDLQTQVTRLMNENALLIKKLESIEDIKEQKVRILQLRNNPFLQDQMVKKEQLEVLKRENEDLLKKTTFTDTVPKSVYDSLQFKNQELEKRIYDLNKRIQRLREIFTAKSKEFIDAVFSLLGFRLEFQQTGKIKLVSKYAMEDSLVIDPANMTLKRSGTTEAFNGAWDRLLDFWIREKENVPCFLAALTLELYELERHKSDLL